MDSGQQRLHSMRYLLVPLALILCNLNGLDSHTDTGQSIQDHEDHQRQHPLLIKEATWAHILRAAYATPFEWLAFSRAMDQGEAELQLNSTANGPWLHHHPNFTYHRVRVARGVAPGRAITAVQIVREEQGNIPKPISSNLDHRSFKHSSQRRRRSRRRSRSHLHPEKYKYS